MTAQIFLKNPLYKGRYGGQRDRELKEPVVEIHGRSEHRDGGVEVQVEALFDVKGKPVDAPFERLFLPMGKIDYIVIVEA
jgi:hypothetical protein